jgi:aerobic carbon-monoxide dehydrogenase small subunit
MSSSSKCEIPLTVNGEKYSVIARQADTLLFVLRNHLGLTGAKPGCLNGDCGACTVLMDKTPIKSCMILAIEAIGKSVTTIEGLRDAPIQRAFVEHFAFQCGYCTPGFIMNAHALVESTPNASDPIIEKWLESNVCRCTSYFEIEQAVKSVLAEKQASKD